MSLHVLADHMASKGRGPDSMLVHMSPREVAGLHALALKHGGSLTINPDTGLPEAGFLDKLLPTLIGGGISYLSGGLIDPMTAAAMVGGVETIRTGSLERGLMAGFGAYGGAGLAQGFMGAGAAGLAGEAATLAGQQATEQGLTEAARSQAIDEAVRAQGFNEAVGKTAAGDVFSKGLSAAATNPMGFAKDNFKYLAGAAAPIMADMMVPTTTKAPPVSPSFIRQKRVNPDGTVTDLTPVNAADWGSRNFSDIYRGYNGGGIVALAAGGAGTDAVAGAAAPQTVEDLYKSIGRTPDKEGLAFWQSNFGTGPVNAAQAASFMESANAVKAKEAAAAAAPAVVAPTTITAPTGGVPDLAFTPNVADTTGITALQPQATTPASSVLPPPAQTAISTADAQTAVNNIYRNVLGRDADATGLNFWSNAIANGRSVDSVYQDILKSANEIKTAGTLGNFGIKTMTAADAAKPYTGYTSTASETVADEWVRNVLGREPTAAEKAQSWYKDSSNLGTTAEAAKVYRDFKDYAASKGKATNLSWMEASQLKALPTTKVDTIVGGGGTDTINNTFGSSTEVDRKITNPFGNATNPGDLTYNADGTITVQPNIPGRPYGGFSGMNEVKNAYTKGGGSLGYTSPVVKTAADHNTAYNTLTGDSEAAYNYLMGKGANPVKSNVGEIARPYSEATLGFPASTNKMYNWDAASGKMVRNPDYVATGRNAKGDVTYGMSLNDIKKYLNKKPLQGASLYNWAKENNLSAQDIAAATGMTLSEVYAQFREGQTANKATDAADTGTVSDGGQSGGFAAAGGLQRSYADGGITGNGQLNLNIPLNLGGSGGSNGYSAAGGYQGQGNQNSVQQSGMPDFRNQMQGFDAQIQKLPSVMAYNDYTKSIGGRPPTAEEMAQVDQLRKGITGDQGFMDLQSQMQSMGNKYQQQAMGNQSPGLQQRYMQQSPTVTRYAAGGYAVGGGLGSLGSYSDGGRLLRGPGDGVSDSIPATIGAKNQPARLADGEFVVPARIVSELGNGSTDAGAKKLYAMMDRVQRARGKTTGKNKVAANSRADKHLPA